MENHIILSVQDLDVKFTLRGQTLHAIRGVSLDVYEGESLAIVGESGSGKSVFVKTFMGLLLSLIHISQATVKPMNREVRVPDQIRDQTSWPSLLVPKI